MGQEMWTYTVLEIYRMETDWPDGYAPRLLPWPDFGVPADWIKQGLVGYCQGCAEDLVRFIPLWKLLWWKIKGWLPERLVKRKYIMGTKDENRE